MPSVVRSAVAVAALLATTMSLIPSGASASVTEPWRETTYDVNATWYFPMYGRISRSSDPESLLKYQRPPYKTMPYQYRYECQVIPGTTPSKSYPGPVGVGGEMTSGLVTHVVPVYVPILLSPSVTADAKKFVYVCRGSVLLNGVDITVHDGSDISSDTVFNEFNNLTHTIWFKIDQSKLALVPK
jgi:hypothetical protein